MQDSLGRHLNGTIVTVGDDTVTMDFNHPMAGKDLFFKGKVLAVRDATDEELESLHSHKCATVVGLMAVVGQNTLVVTVAATNQLKMES
jgi:FKBP-type peptidyl-prolyl cis-trans isomerase 2